LAYQPIQEDTMHPSIATMLVAQRQRELLAAAEHHRRIRGFARTPRGRKARSDGTVRGRPQVSFQTWLAAGRL
jgi:hypothetical protein